MIQTLLDYDSITAAGILARIALALDDEGNPASKSVIPNESLVRQKVLRELRARLGLAHDDDSAESIERVSQELDDESDSLLETPNPAQALTDLSQKGRLPSDLFFVQIADNVKKFYGDRFEEERVNIEQTVAFPDMEEHFGGGSPVEKGKLFSLFTKRFQHEFPFKSFTLLVMGQRQGTLLMVSHSWRIYSDRVDLSGAANMMDIMKRFADVFGLTIDVDGKQGKFIMSKDALKNESLSKSLMVLPVTRLDRRGKPYTVDIKGELTCFSLMHGEHVETAFLAIDLDRYRKSLEAHDW